MLDQPTITTTTELRPTIAVYISVLEAVLRLPEGAVQGVRELLEDVSGKTTHVNADLAKTFLGWFGIRATLDQSGNLSDEDLTERC